MANIALPQDLAMHVALPCAFDTVLRMRTNAGIRAVEFCGNFMMQNATDMEMAVVTPGSCVTVEVKHDDKLPEDLMAYVQVHTSIMMHFRISSPNDQFMPHGLKVVDTHSVLWFLSYLQTEQ